MDFSWRYCGLRSIFVASALLLACVSSQEEGQCKRFEPSRIDGRQLNGLWYQTHATEAAVRCGNVLISMLEDNSTLQWEFGWKDLANDMGHTIQGQAVPGAATDLYNIYTFSSEGQNMTIQVAGVRYDEFLVLRQCLNLNTTHYSEEVHVFSKTPKLNNLVLASAVVDAFSNFTKLQPLEQDELICNKSPALNLINLSIILLLSLVTIKF